MTQWARTQSYLSGSWWTVWLSFERAAQVHLAPTTRIVSRVMTSSQFRIQVASFWLSWQHVECPFLGQKATSATLHLSIRHLSFPAWLCLIFKNCEPLLVHFSFGFAQLASWGTRAWECREWSWLEAVCRCVCAWRPSGRCPPQIQGSRKRLKSASWACILLSLIVLVYDSSVVW